MKKSSGLILLGFVMAGIAVPAFAGNAIAVPEPSSLALLVSAIGSVGGVAALRRIRK